MTTRSNTIKNPLTIIAIFAGLTETVGTIAISLTSSLNQTILTVFVVAFPFTLVLLFFRVLKKDPTSLYAPSDFINEEHYMTIIEQKKQTLENNLSGFYDSINEIVSSIGNIETRLASDKLIHTTRETIVKTLQDFGELNIESSNQNDTYLLNRITKEEALEKKLISILKNESSSLTYYEIKEKINDSSAENDIIKTLHNLKDRGLITQDKSHSDSETFYYSLAKN